LKFLVISYAGIGDTFFATPLIHELRANFPDSAIDVFVRWKGSKDLLEGNPHVTTVFQKDLVKPGQTGSLKLLWQLRKNRYDVSINTHPQSRVAYRAVARVINARLRLSHTYDNRTPLDEVLVSRTIPQDYEAHAIENNLRFLELLDAKSKLARHEYEIYLSPSELAWTEEWLAAQKLTGRKLLGIHVGSGGTKNLALRRWPLASYSELIKTVNRELPDLAVLLFGGPEEEKDHARLIAESKSGQVFHPQTKSLRQAAALVKKCDAFLSVDTALMHVAAAMKVRKQIVIETPTWNKPIQPYNNPFLLVKNPAVAGRNLEYYRYDGRGIQGSNEELVQCMESVSVDAVFSVLKDAMQ
jgi:heptosyltransferase-2